MEGETNRITVTLKDKIYVTKSKFKNSENLSPWAFALKYGWFP
jgi:hypothetical protein